MKTKTKENKYFTEFKCWFIHYQMLFGLLGYQVYFICEPMDDCYAHIDVSNGKQVATVTFNANIPFGDHTDKNIRELALHEALHLLLSRIESNARWRYASSEEIGESIEEVVVKLEKLIGERK